jgi:hemolysin D
MNDRAAPPAKIPPQPPAPRAAPAVSGRDRKFLPAALEILETPPPPLPIALISIICAFALAALTWSFFCRPDVHATAPGKIETAGYSKVIEPLDPGKIAGIHVETGEAVKAGDLLPELDPAEAGADAASARDALDASFAEVARRRYAIGALKAAETEKPPAESAAGDPSWKDPKDKAEATLATVLSPIENIAGQSELHIPWSEGLPEPFQLREEAVLRADLTQLADALKALDKQMAQKLATRKRLDMSIAFQNTLMETPEPARLHQAAGHRPQRWRKDQPLRRQRGT